MCGIKDLQHIPRVNGQDDILWNRVGSRRGSPILCALRFHPDMHVFVVYEMSVRRLFFLKIGSYWKNVLPIIKRPVFVP